MEIESDGKKDRRKLAQSSTMKKQEASRQRIVMGTNQSLMDKRLFSKHTFEKFYKIKQKELQENLLENFKITQFVNSTLANQYVSLSKIFRARYGL